MEYKVELNGETMTVVFHRYASNNAIAIQLIDNTGFPYATATVNVEGYNPPDSLVVIKNWSENNGVLQALIDGGIVSKPEDQVRAGYAWADICKLLVPIE